MKVRLELEPSMTLCILPAIAKAKKVSLEDILNLLSTGFIKGGTGFLKTSTAGEMIKGGGSINREVRVGVTHVS